MGLKDNFSIGISVSSIASAPGRYLARIIVGAKTVRTRNVQRPNFSCPTSVVSYPRKFLFQKPSKKSPLRSRDQEQTMVQKKKYLFLTTLQGREFYEILETESDELTTTNNASGSFAIMLTRNTREKGEMLRGSNGRGSRCDKNIQLGAHVWQVNFKDEEGQKRGSRKPETINQTVVESQNCRVNESRFDSKKKNNSRHLL